MLRAVAIPSTLAVGLVGLTLFVLAPTLENGFLEFDDSDGVTRNPMVAHGLTKESVLANLAHPYVGNYHPLTSLSHALVVEVAGLEPRVHHAVNLGLHAANVVLLFFVLRTTTGSTWRSAAAAAVFAIHPVNVEPVAWVTSRKDLLSFCFAMASLLAWCRYVNGPRAATYAAAVALYFCSLLSKMSLVALPAALALLDYWPFARLPGRSTVVPVGSSPHGSERAAWRRLVLEKLPFVPVAAVLLVVIRRTHLRDAPSSFDPEPLWVRVPANYVAYLRQSVLPTDLSASYRPVEDHTSAAVVGCWLLLGAITLAAWKARRSCPAVLVGWLWFVGMFAPTIGFLRMADTLRADRYMYVPLVGLLVAAAWGLERGLRSLGRAGIAVQAAAWIAAVAAGGAASSVEATYWHDDLTLFARAVQVDDRSPTAWLNYGTELKVAGRLDEAAAAYRRSLALSPRSREALIGLGNVELVRGRPDEALPWFDQARSLAPDDPRVLVSCSIAFRALARDDEADALLERAVRTAPASKEIRAHAGRIEFGRERDDAAVGHLRQALHVDSGDAQVRSLLVAALVRSGRRRSAAGDASGALQRFDEALRLDPTDDGVRGESARLREAAAPHASDR